MLPGEAGRSVEHGGRLDQLGGDLAVALVHPHVAQRVGIERGYGVGEVEVVLDRRHEAVVERQHQVQVGPLPVGVLAAVVVGRAAVPVARHVSVPRPFAIR